jgi:hypothetical protein
VQGYAPSASSDHTQWLTGFYVIDHDSPTTGGDRRVRALAAFLNEASEKRLREFA